MRKLIASSLLLVSILLPNFVFASLGRILGDTTVNATVPSKVIPENSEATSNVSSILADISQRVIITVKLKDKSGNPLPNIRVELFSNRGDIDQIKAVQSKNGSLTALSTEDKTQNNVTLSDSQGFAYFRISSTVAGEAIFTPVADTIVKLTPIKVTFMPLPFPKSLTVSLMVPSFINPQEKIVLFKPAQEAIDKEKLVNTGIEIQIPLTPFLVVVLVILLEPIFMAITFYLTRKIKRAEEKEAKYIEREQEYLKKQTEFLEKMSKR